MKAAPLLLVVAIVTSCRPAPAELLADLVVPGRGGLPTFSIECRNDTDHAIERFNAINTVRVDGTVVPLKIVGSIIGGPPPPMPSGSSWTEMIALAPTDYRGFDVGIPLYHVPLVHGRHMVAFRCANRWSMDVAFSWEPPS
jgi:hypothetical protein